MHKDNKAWLAVFFPYNVMADALAQLVSRQGDDSPETILIETLELPSTVVLKSILLVAIPSISLVEPILAFLQSETLPQDNNEARSMCRWAAR